MGLRSRLACPLPLLRRLLPALLDEPRVASASSFSEGAGRHLDTCPQAPSGLLGGGAFLTESPRDVAELRRPRRQARAPGWEGVVLVTPAPERDDSFEAELHEWGDRAARVGALVVFGDPELVRAVAQAAR